MPTCTLTKIFKLNALKSYLKYLANHAQERRQDLIQEESKWMKVVADVMLRLMRIRELTKLLLACWNQKPKLNLSSMQQK
jgi:hypothetical protein